MQRFAFLGFLMTCVLAGTVQAEGLAESKSKFYYKNSEGEFGSARIIRRYYWKSIVHPFATVDPRIDRKLRRAATIAQERANAHSKARCWQRQGKLRESNDVDEPTMIGQLEGDSIKPSSGN